MSRRTFDIVGALCVINFILFAIGDHYLRGNAMRGKVIGNHYFPGWGGQLTEVSRATFIYSELHGATAFLGIIFCVLYGWRFKRQNKTQK